MQTKKDHSYGVIPIFKEGDTWKVFILNQISLKKDIYWTFPKGHKEGNETHEEAALRELSEEADITLSKLDTTHAFEQEYNFIHDGIQIDKKVTYYLGYATNTNFTIQPEEVSEGKWCTFPEAYDTLTHEKAKKTLSEVEKYLADK